jgi:lysophospholipase L1-like esterase
MYTPSSNAGEVAQWEHVNDMRGGDIVALTIGGNDMEWTKLIASCARFQVAGLTAPAPGIVPGNPEDCQRRKNEAPEVLDNVTARLEILYRMLLARTDADVYVLLYPPMVPARSPDVDSDCRLHRLGAGQLSVSADTGHQMVDIETRLNQAIRESVARIGDQRLRLVDVEAAFGGYEGHTISCGIANRPGPWVNSLLFSVQNVVPNLPRDPSVDAAEPLERLSHRGPAAGSFHPNVDGQQAMARALLDEIRR